ncbi:hypothetical protein AB0F68_13170 [Micromonospora sp. NPDC023966]|jgi:hypothetical protein
MFGFPRRGPKPLSGVRFCESCAQVSTAAQRAERRYDRTRTTVYPLISPR